MARIWGAVAAVAALTLLLGVVALYAVAGVNVGHRSMMNGWTSGGIASARGTGEYEYLAQMVAHHEEAITAAAQLQRSDRPQLRRLGTSIVSSQTEQVATMKSWLAAWYPGRPVRDPGYVPEMRDLTTLSGDRLDRVFLVDMIGHHMMAVMQSQHLLVRGGTDHEKVVDLARTIRDDQRAEIALMVSWLRDWYPQVRPGSTGMMPGPMLMAFQSSGR